MPTLSREIETVIVVSLGCEVPRRRFPQSELVLQSWRKRSSRASELKCCQANMSQSEESGIAVILSLSAYVSSTGATT